MSSAKSTGPHLPPKSAPDMSSSQTSVTIDPTSEDANVGEDVNTQFEHQAYGPGPGEKPEDSFEVIMGPQDPDNPKTWGRVYRWYITMAAALLLMNAYVSYLRTVKIHDPLTCFAVPSRLLHQKGSFFSSWSTLSSGPKSQP